MTDTVKICTFCDKPHKFITVYHEGGNICPSCRVRFYRKNPENFKVCADCKRVRPAAGAPNGKHLCSTCLSRTKRHCKICDRQGVFKDAKCELCYISNAQITRICLVCNEVFTLHNKNEDAICSNCYRKYYKANTLREECFYCKKIGQVAIRLDNGAGCCGNCRKKFHTIHKNCPRCKLKAYLFYNSVYDAKVCAACDSDLRSNLQNRFCKSCARKFSVEEMGIEVFCPTCR